MVVVVHVLGLRVLRVLRRSIPIRIRGVRMARLIILLPILRLGAVVCMCAGMRAAAGTVATIATLMLHVVERVPTCPSTAAPVATIATLLLHLVERVPACTSTAAPASACTLAVAAHCDDTPNRATSYYELPLHGHFTTQQ